MSESVSESESESERVTDWGSESERNADSNTDMYTAADISYRCRFSYSQFKLRCVQFELRYVFCPKVSIGCRKGNCTFETPGETRCLLGTQG